MSQHRVIAKGLLDEFRQALHDIFEWVNYYKTRRINAPFTADANVNRLCFAIEKILSHGLKEFNYDNSGQYIAPRLTYDLLEGLFSRKTVWDFLSHLEECLPGPHVAQLIDEIKTIGQSAEGRARIFVRYALNNNCLAEYIQSLVWHPELTESHYQDYALLRNEDERNMFISLLESISPVNFSLKLKDLQLNQEKYWLAQPMIPTRPPVILPDEEEVPSPGRGSAPSSEQLDSPKEISARSPEESTMQFSVDFSHVPELLTRDSSISSRDRELLYELYKEIAALLDEHAVNPLPIYTQRGVALIQQLEVIARQGLTGVASQLWDWVALLELHWSRGTEFIARVRALIEAVNFSDDPEHVTEATGDTIGPVTIRSKLGYFRAALFEAANQQLLDELFRALVNIPHEQISQLFSLNALVTQSRAAEILLVLLRAVKPVTFKLRLEQQRLDLEDYYQRVRDEALVEVNLFGQDKRTGKRRRPVKRVVALDTDSPNGHVIEERHARRSRDLDKSPTRDQPSRVDEPSESPNNEHVIDEPSESPNNEHVIDEHVTDEPRESSVNNESQVTDSNHVPEVTDHVIEDTHSDAASSVGDTDSTAGDMLLNIDSMMREHDHLLQQVEQALVDHHWNDESRDELNTSVSGTLPSSDTPLAANSQVEQSPDDAEISVDDELTAQIMNPSAELTRMLTHPVPLASPEKEPARDVKPNLGYILQSRVVDDYQPKIDYLFIAEDDSHDMVHKRAAEDEKELFDERVITRQLSERDYNLMPMFINIDDQSFILDQPVKTPLTAASRCAGCGRQLSSGFFKTVRYCHYTGGHYCSECHDKKRAIIPARVVHHWDFREYSVCTAAKKHIDSHFDDPIINVGVNNPQLYDWVTALNQLRKLRRQMIPLSEYVLRCKHCAPIVISLQSRLHLLQQLHVYSLKDLMEVRTGVLLPFMYKLMEQFIVHVTRQCPLCRGQGHICDICNNRKEVLFPFQLDKIALCLKCKSVYHRHCFALVSGNCPKCLRKMSLKAKSAAESADNSGTVTPVNYTQ